MLKVDYSSTTAHHHDSTLSRFEGALLAIACCFVSINSREGSTTLNKFINATSSDTIDGYTLMCRN
jgi:hypothetical protein